MSATATEMGAGPPSAGPRPDPEAIARALHARFDIRHPREIAIELIAYHCGARVVWRDAGGADARVVRSGGAAYLAIARAARGTPRARFSMAHELGHVLMHPGDDSLARIHGAARSSSREYAVEREADRFASTVLVPSHLAAPMCAASPPALDAVGALAREFDVSLTVAARRWVQLAPTACAVVESRGDVIKRAGRSDAWRGVAVGRRKLEEGTLALEMAHAGNGAEAGKRVHAKAWGSAQAGAEIVEECVPLGEAGAVLTWLWHGSDRSAPVSARSARG